jgi:hypothetical protein
MEYQKSEAEVLNERLSRRYDPGMALNEAAKRAIEQKTSVGIKSPDNLTEKQKMALEFQAKYLKKVIGQS